MERIHGLDLLRADAMLMGVLLHATLPFLYNAELVRPPTWIFLLFTSIHILRMPVFFILAGFFAALSLQRKATSSFAWDRFYRIALPLIVWFLKLKT